jgi:hypothetical protein
MIISRQALKIFGFSLMLKLSWTLLNDLNQVNGVDDDDLQNLLDNQPDLKNVDDEIRNRFQERIEDMKEILDKKLAKLSPAQSMSESDGDFLDTSNSETHSDELEGPEVQKSQEIPSEVQAAANTGLDETLHEEKLETIQLDRDSGETKFATQNDLEDEMSSVGKKERLNKESLNKLDSETVKNERTMVSSWLDGSSEIASNLKFVDTQGANKALEPFQEKLKPLSRSKSVLPEGIHFMLKSSSPMDSFNKPNEELLMKELKPIEKTVSAQSTDSAFDSNSISAANSETEINFQRKPYGDLLSPHGGQLKETLRKSLSAQSKDSGFENDFKSGNDFMTDNDFKTDEDFKSGNPFD